MPRVCNPTNSESNLNSESRVDSEWSESIGASAFEYYFKFPCASASAPLLVTPSRSNIATSLPSRRRIMKEKTATALQWQYTVNLKGLSTAGETT
jgi:hypothetical protein